MEFSDVLWKFVESFVVALVPILVPLLAAWILPKVIGAWKGLKDRLGDNAWMLDDVATIAVRAAEQAKVGALAAEKKDYAIGVAQAYLKEKGIKLDLALIDAAIEAAVLQEFNRAKLAK